MRSSGPFFFLSILRAHMYFFLLMPDIRLKDRLTVRVGYRLIGLMDERMTDCLNNRMNDFHTE